MPIIIGIDQIRKYMTAGAIGELSDEDLLDAWQSIVDGDAWVPGMPQLIDLGALEASPVTLQGIETTGRPLPPVVSAGMDLSTDPVDL